MAKKITAISTFILLCILSISSGYAQQTRALEDDGIYYLKKSDGKETYTLTGDEIIFKCSSDGKVPTSRDAGVTFIPRPGEIIQVTIEDIDLDGQTYYLQLYHGDIAIGYSLPKDYFAKIGLEAKGDKYQSDSDNGAMTIGFHSPYSSNTYKGWTIRVQSVVPADMTYKSTEVFNQTKETSRGQKSQTIYGFKIITEGKGSPLQLTEIDLATAIASSDIENLKLYSTGTSSDFKATNEIASISTDQSTQKISTDITLNNGANYFWIAGDIKPSAKVGSTLSATLKSVSIGTTKQTPTPNTSLTPTKINSDILMQAVPTVFEINEPINFYDDGGKDGKITLEFEGTTTFVPSSPNKRIQIDFKKLEIFNTSSIGKNDILKFYNGRNVDEANLNTTLLHKAEIVKSMADDGSLTVYLKSTTGVAANGWEAIVSEYQPSAMEYVATTIEKQDPYTVAGGQTNVKMLLFNVQTKNELNPSKLEKIQLDATGTTTLTNIDNVKVYYLGKEKEVPLTSAQLVTSSALSTSSSFNLEPKQPLREGNNYFVITYDINAKASNKDEFALSLKDITVGGKKTNIDENKSTVSVENIFKHREGDVIQDIYGEWIYTDTKESEFSSNYKAGTTNSIITFVPKIPGTIVEIDFENFDIYYATSSYGTKATFEIYSGSETKASELLWKLDDANKAKVGPGKKLRSTASNGSLTIKFNPNSSTSYYTAKGWKAVVRPFLNHEMTVDEINIYQDNTKPVKPGSKKEEILRFDLLASGNITTAKLQNVSLDLKESLSSISKVSIYKSDNKDGFDEATEVGSIVPTQTKINIPVDVDLPEDYSYYWVVYDIKDDPESDAKLDAAITTLTIDNKEVKIEKGDPDGERIIKYTIELQEGDNGEVILNKGYLFYDDGGADNNYSKDFKGYITFKPSDPDKVVKVVFNNFRTATMDKLYVYSGTSSEDNTKLLTTLSGQSVSIPCEYVGSKEDGGAITIRFSSSAYGATIEGWEASVFSYTPVNLEIAKVETSLVGDEQIVRGGANEPIMKVAVNVTGDISSLNIEKLAYGLSRETDLKDLSKVSLFYTGASSGFIANDAIATSEPKTDIVFELTKKIEITEAGTYYFWLAADVNKTASAGKKIGVSLASLTADVATIEEISVLTPSEKIIKAGMSGEYLIGKSSSADFDSFKNAFDKIQGGMEGPVKLKVEAGTYNEDVFIPSIAGTSAENVLTITSLSGKNDDVILKGKGYNKPPYGDPDYGLFTINNTDYVVVENLSIIPKDQSYPYAIQVRNSSRNVTIRNCVLKADLVTSGYSGMNLIQTTAINEEGKNNDFLTIKGNELTGGYIALYLGGTGYVALTKEKGLVVEDNKIYESYSKGIYVMDEQEPIINNNIVINKTTTKTGYQGMDIYRATGRFVISNNKIMNQQSAYSFGIEIREAVKDDKDVRPRIYNNALAITSSNSASTRGLLFGKGDHSNLDVYNNSIVLTGTGGMPIGTNNASTTITNIALVNNLLQANGGSPIYFFNKADQAQGITYSHNVYFTNGNKFAQSSLAGTFEDWIDLVSEKDSKVEQASFFTTSDLHLREQGTLNVGKPVSWIEKDIDGNAKSGETPTVGAYEYIPFTIETPQMFTDYPKVLSKAYNKIDLGVKLTQPGVLYYIIKKKDETAPTVEEFSSASSIELGLYEEASITLDGLEELTDYKVYFFMKSIFEMNSLVIESGVLSTPIQIHEFVVTLPRYWGERIPANTDTEISATVTGGVAPYTYEWKDAKNNVIGNEAILVVKPEIQATYTLTVKDSASESKTVRTGVHVESAQRIATFEDNYLEQESYWKGYDNEESTTFMSGTFEFSNFYYPELMTWGGTGYANLTATTFDPSQMLEQQFRSATGKGANDSKTYGIVYAYGFDTKIKVSNTTDGDQVQGVYLTNAAYTVSSMEKGDSFVGSPFKQGDWYKVTFTGTAIDGNKESVDCYLADYRSENATEHYILKDWKWFDLSTLGKVTDIKVTVSGSRSNQMGLTIPGYFCMDDFGSADPTEPLYTIDINGEEVSAGSIYAVECGVDQANVKISPKLGYEVWVDGEKSTTNSFEMTHLVSGINSKDFILKSSSTGTEVKESIQIEKYFDFDNAVTVRWQNNGLMITQEMVSTYNLTGFKWFRNGELISDKHYYSAGNAKSDKLDKEASYSLEMTTKDGIVLHTCPALIKFRANAFQVYPTVVNGNGNISVMADYDEHLLNQADIVVYNMHGNAVNTVGVTEKETKLQAPATPGVYIIKLNAKSFTKSEKIIVK